MTRFAFKFDRVHRVLGAPFGVTPQTTMVEIEDGMVRARFGPWLVETPASNVVETQVTGPYTVPKTAGPAHLSVADRGLTLATNSEAGLCLRFATPVRGIDPFGWIRHPGLTVTVERIDDLQRVLDGRTDPDHLDGASTGSVGESPWAIAGRWLRWSGGMALAAGRYLRRARDVSWSFEKSEDPPPTLGRADGRPGEQPMDETAGPTYERVFRVEIRGSRLTPEQLLDRVASDLNAVSPTEVAEFVDRTSESQSVPGQEYEVRMPGPWSAPVRCFERTPTSFTFVTLEGHMEAGQIEFRTAWGDDGGDPSPETRPVVFEIRSVARARSRTFDLLYERLRLAATMQKHMWVHLCRRVTTVAGGEQEGPVEVKTVRYAG